MRFCEDFGRLLSLAVAIRRRDEVAVKQFLKVLATEAFDEFEVIESSRAPQPKSSEATRRQSKRLDAVLAAKMAELNGLVDQDGMAWLKAQLPH